MKQLVFVKVLPDEFQKGQYRFQYRESWMEKICNSLLAYPSEEAARNAAATFIKTMNHHYLCNFRRTHER